MLAAGIGLLTMAVVILPQRFKPNSRESSKSSQTDSGSSPSSLPHSVADIPASPEDQQQSDETALPTSSSNKRLNSDPDNAVRTQHEFAAAGLSGEQVSRLNPEPNRLLAEFCVKCHGPDTQESDLRLDHIALEMHAESDIEIWQSIYDRMTLGEMPPPESQQPSSDDRRTFLTELSAKLQEARSALTSTGHTGLRRLNKAEYKNTIRDLTGLDFDFDKASFPPDSDTGEFDTLAHEQTISGTLMQKYVFIAEQIASEAVRRRRSTYPQLFGLEASEANASNAEPMIRRFAARAFRRPVDEEKLGRLIELFDTEFSIEQSFESAIKLVIQAVLCSPQFLYFIEGEGELDDHAVASRMSYFLWSSMPDDELYRLATEGTLNTPSVRQQQVTRMLRDQRSSEFVRRFTGQWLGVRDVGVMQPDREQFPEYDEELEESMRIETELFFAEILQNDESIFNFIDSDFAILNGRLAKHYGIPGVSGRQFRRVQLKPEYHRGGVLGHASILSITSDGVTSSPVVRGAWILSNLLGTPPPPPPADVPDIEPDTRGTQTIREELARHRTNDACNSCHRRIDPLGFALENYDAFGRWRSDYVTRRKARKKKNRVLVRTPVDASGTLPDGRPFSDAVDLRKLLMSRKDTFRRCLTVKLLTYGIGRAPSISERSEVDEAIRKLADNGDQLSHLIRLVIQSRPFLNR